MLVVVIVLLWLDRRSLLADNIRYKETAERIVDDYRKGGDAIREAIKSLIAVLIEIKKKL